MDPVLAARIAREKRDAAYRAARRLGLVLVGRVGNDGRGEAVEVYGSLA